MIFYYDRHGQPIPEDEYLRLMRDKEYKRVAWDDLPDGRHLSTVWLGLDHSWTSDPPIIFETMLFGVPEDYKGETQWRYSTEEEAKMGHASILAALLKGEEPPES